MSEQALRLLGEDALTPTQATRLLPGRRGRACHRDTVVRWITRGRAGVRLEAYRTPGGWVTTRQAVARFVAASEDAGEEPQPVRPAPASPEVDEKRVQEALRDRQRMRDEETRRARR
jgi:hypothetical protein